MKDHWIDLAPLVEASLRVELDALTTETSCAASEQAITELVQSHPHSIRKVADGSGYPQSCTCFVHAFGLHDLRDEFFAFSNGTRHQDDWRNPQFADWLIDERLLQPQDIAGARDGDYVIYRDITGAKHAGILDRGSVVSKWGYLDVYRHELAEIPMSYGMRACCFACFSGAQLFLDAFRQYVRGCTASKPPTITFSR